MTNAAATNCLSGPALCGSERKDETGGDGRLLLLHTARDDLLGAALRRLTARRLTLESGRSPQLRQRHGGNGAGLAHEEKSC